MSLIHLLAVLSLLTTNSARNNIEFTKDSLAVVKQHVLKNKAVLVDVRSEHEWKQGHIEGSIFLPVTSLRKGGDPKMLAKTLPKKKILYTFCVVGMRARTAAYALEKHGYTVRALKPGYDELLKAGFKKGKQLPEASAAGNENTRQRNAG
ncbi:MAG: rhodanese-like domain-containing protein [Pirellulales bacterium]